MQQESSSQCCIIVEKTETSSPEVFGIFSGWQWESLRGKFLRAGIVPEQCKFVDLQKSTPAELQAIEANVFVAMGDGALQALTGKRGIDKWQLSPLDTLPQFKTRKCVPTFGMARTQKQFELGLYQELALQRAFAESKTPSFARIPERFHSNPGLEETLALLEDIAMKPELAVDVETGYGQINTVGFAWSPSDAIAINVLPERLGDTNYRELWQKIANVLRGPSRKIFQNFIYDVSYFSAYGIRTENIAHDTMWAMKFLWPELDANLGNVGRLYTNRPYWKDDGKVEHEEGKKKDWGNVRDWDRHYLYNQRDTTGTFEAAQAQRKDLKERGLEALFDGYLMRLHEPILEMCSNGMPLSLLTRESLKVETEARVAALTKELHTVVGREINPASPKQKLAYLKELGIKVPKKFDKEKGTYRESADASSLKKIRLKHPDVKALSLFTDIASLQKALSSYINFDVKPGEAKVRYMLGKFTETLRFAGGSDGWGRGFNIQTIPREGGEVSIKQMFVADEGESFLEVDLKQAESRFVAYDSADKTFIDMLESGSDVHTYVGEAILKQMGKDPKAISKEEFKGTWRQLGKKAGHGLNYFMKPAMFAETVFNELDLVISKKDAELITQVYYNLFAGIPKWHAWIRKELGLKRKLSAPSGWERYFYGRFGDDMFKEAYAWRPQHTIPWITNRLMLHMCDERKHNRIAPFKLIYQGHDALIMTTRDEDLDAVAKVCQATKPWHPEVLLAGGNLIIPTEVKVGKCLAKMHDWEGA